MHTHIAKKSSNSVDVYYREDYIPHIEDLGHSSGSIINDLSLSSNGSAFTYCVELFHLL